MALQRPLWHWRPQFHRLDPEDAFFDQGNLACQLQYHKQFCLPSDYLKEAHHHSEFVCHQQNCSQKFTTILAYEMHYNALHRNSCSLCLRILPNRHLLELHLVESHDQMFCLVAAKKPMYRCLLENCPVTLMTSEERKDHLIKTHSYPANFRFAKVSKSPKKSEREKSSVRDRKKPDSTSCETTSGTKESNEEQMEVVSSVEGQVETRRRFQPRIPKNISFGHGVSRGFFRPASSSGRGKHRNPWQQKNRTDGCTETAVNIEDVRMEELSECLDAS